MMGRIITLAFAALLALLSPHAVVAEPADIDAAARGVVRVVVIGTDGERIFPVSHGTGFAVSPTRILTNAHVLGEALEDDELRIGIVPGDGQAGVYAKVVAVSERNDLALLEVTGSVRLPPLAIAGGGASGNGEVAAVGYPMNVDKAQGLEITDILQSQPPVKSRGFVSGTRPSRQFDTVLHTAPIASGNSGGPLLDACGRVVGVNSFGTESDGSGAEFFFAVSTRELLPFLRANGVRPRIVTEPCRTLAEIEAQEREQAAAATAAERDRAVAAAETQRARRDRAQLEAQLAIAAERENHIALAFLLVLAAVGGGVAARQLYRGEHGRRNAIIAGGAALLALAGALGAWLSRPGLEELDERVKLALGGGAAALPDAGATGFAGSTGDFVCRFEPARSRVTGGDTQDVGFAWAADGCVNGRTQYGDAGDGRWQRVLVPRDEDVVTVQTFTPATRTLTAERFLLERDPMRKLRAARDGLDTPSCGTPDAGQSLGEAQRGLVELLPDKPNERLVYRCNPR